MKKIVFSNVFFSFLIIILGLLGSILISRTLGPSQRGEIAAIILWPTLLLYLGSFGTFQAVIFHFSKKNRNIQNLWGSCLLITSINSIISIICGGILIFLTLNILKIEYKWYSFIYLLFIPLSIISQFIASVLLTKSYFNIYNYIRFFYPISYFLVILFLYIFKVLKLENIILAQILLTISQFIIFIIVYNKRVDSIFNFKYHKKTVIILYNYGFKVWLGDLSQGLNAKMDQILISTLLLSSELGLYVVATSVANFTTIVPNGFKTVLLPLISSTKSNIEKLKISNRILKKFVFINLGVIFLCFIINPIAIPLLFGEEFRGSVNVSFVLLFGYVFFNIKIILASIVQGFGKPIFVSYSELIGLIVLLIIAYPISQEYGLLGASLSISLSYFIQFLVIFVFYQKKINN